MGVAFEYTGGRTVTPRSWAGRRVGEVYGLLQCARRLASLKRNAGLDLALLYTNDSRFIGLFSRMCHALSVPVVMDLCEWPLSKATAYGINVSRARRFMADVMPRVDGVIPISAFLEDKVEEYEYDHDCRVPHLKVPILVDTSLFTPLEAVPKGVPVFLWSGSLDYTRVTKAMIDACVLLKSDKVDFGLIVLGGISPEYQLQKLRAYIAKTMTSGIVTVLDYVDVSQLGRLYGGATALMVLLVDDDISRSRFPTKLGEFLSVGRPVIATAMGEMKRYLTDRQTAFLVEGTSPQALAQKMLDVLSDPGLAGRVGRAGRALAESEFSYLHQGARLASFLRSVAAGFRASGAQPR